MNSNSTHSEDNKSPKETEQTIDISLLSRSENKDKNEDDRTPTNDTES